MNPMENSFRLFFGRNRVATLVSLSSISWPGVLFAEGTASEQLFVRRIQPLFSEKYLLTLRSDAGARLFIDDKLVIDAWGVERSAYHQGSVMLDASKRHALRVEYRQPKSGMMVKLDWASPNQQPEMIPVERLSTDQ